MKKLFVLSTLFMILACGDPVADLKEEVIAIHDEVMPEMSTIHRLSKDLAVAAGDSLRTEAQRIKINANIDALEKSDEAMMTWMAEYRVPGSMVPKAEALELLQQEKLKIIAVRDLMRNSISQAKTILEELEEK